MTTRGNKSVHCTMCHVLRNRVRFISEATTLNEEAHPPTGYVTYQILSGKNPDRKTAVEICLYLLL